MKANALAAIALIGLVAIDATPTPYTRPHMPQTNLDQLSPGSMAQTIPSGVQNLAQQTTKGYASAVSTAFGAVNGMTNSSQTVHALLKGMQDSEHAVVRRRSQGTFQRMIAQLTAFSEAKAALARAGQGKENTLFSALAATKPDARRHDGNHEYENDFSCSFLPSNPPTNAELDHVCTDKCCNYVPELSRHFDIPEKNVDAVVCSKHEDDYCLAMFPNLTATNDVPTSQDLAAICESPCKVSWIGMALVDFMDEFEGAESPAAERLADWFCSKREDESFCSDGGDLVMLFDGEPNAELLSELCGECSDFYFGIIPELVVQAEIAKTITCTKDTDDNFCALQTPDFMQAPDMNMTDANIAEVCNSPCRDSWFAHYFPPISEMPGNFDISAAAERMCMRDTVTGDYCAASPFELSIFSDPDPAMLEQVCNSGCLAFHIQSSSGILGYDTAMAESVLCSKTNDDNFCVFSTPPVFDIFSNFEAFNNANFSALCSHECAESWTGLAGLLLAPIGTEPTTFKDLFCSQEQGDYCLVHLFTSNNSVLNKLDSIDNGDPFAINDEVLDVFCGNGNQCSQAVNQFLFAVGGPDDIIREIVGSDVEPEEAENVLELICHRKESDDQYCLLETVNIITGFFEAAYSSNVKIPQGEVEHIFTEHLGQLLHLMCGECSAQIGQHSAESLLDLIYGGFRRRRSQRGEVGVLLNMMCMEGDDGFCLQDETAVQMLLDGDIYNFGEALIFGTLGMSDDKIPDLDAASRVFCENSCVNSFLSIGVASSGLLYSDSWSLQHECLHPEQQLVLSVLEGACYPNTENEEYCVSTFARSFASSEDIHTSCEVEYVFDEGVGFDEPVVESCSPSCQGNVSGFLGNLGCCSGALAPALPLFAEFGGACGVDVPAGKCGGAGTFALTLEVPNLRFEWVNDEYMHSRIRTGVEHDVAVALGYSQPLVQMKGATEGPSGATMLHVTLELPNEVMAKGLCTRMTRLMARTAPADEAPMLLNALQAISISGFETEEAHLDASQGLVAVLRQSGVSASGDDASRIFAACFHEGGPLPTNPLPTRHYQFRPDAFFANDGTDGPDFPLQSTYSAHNNARKQCENDALPGCYTTYFIDRAVIPNLVASEYGNDGWTACMWMKTEEDPYTFMQWGGTWASTFWYLGYVAAHGGYFFPTASHYNWEMTSQFHVPKSPAEVFSQWRHYCWVVDFRSDGDHFLYIDGSKAEAPYRFDNAIDPTTAQFESNALQNIELGSSAWKTMQFGDIRLYNQPLTPGQVCRVSGSSGCPGAPPAPVPKKPEPTSKPTTPKPTTAAPTTTPKPTTPPPTTTASKTTTAEPTTTIMATTTPTPVDCDLECFDQEQAARRDLLDRCAPCYLFGGGTLN